MRIPAERGYIGNALLTLREICEHLELANDKTTRILLAVEEALLNSMEFGYVDGQGWIDLQFSVEGNEFLVVIEDYGRGMENRDFHAFQTEDEILCDRGRGLCILRGMSDKSVFQTSLGGGTRVTMLFYLQPTEG
jgi:anti-sigma regulatory factor (Ser/Thr protein kinase)